jgi:hypothetical protein
MSIPTLLRRTPAPRPQLVAWTNHFLVEDGRTYAREAWVRFPGETTPRLVPVRGESAGIAA